MYERNLTNIYHIEIIFNKLICTYNLGLQKLKFLMHKILCMQNHFRCMPLHMGNWAHKRVDMHVTNNNMVQ